MIKLEKVEQAKVEEFCCKIYDKLDRKYKKSINDWIYRFFINFFSTSIQFHYNDDNLLKIMTASFGELKELKNYIDCNFYYNLFQQTMQGKIEGTSSLYINYLINRYNTNIDKKKLVDMTKITVCPYCNRNFINVTPKVNGSQLDHFYNKAQYPIFALSFYNLIPSCGPCNLKKGDQEFEYSPYENELVSPVFTFKAKSVNFLTDVKEFTIEWKDNTNPIASEREEKLDLLKLYELHRDVVQELFWKNEIYSDFYKEKIYENFQIGESQIERLITGAYTDEKNYGKRPLSKLVTDISREIGLLREKRE